MNYLDIILIIPLIWALFKGYNKGFISSVAGLLAIILGIYFALKFSDYSIPFLIKHFHKDPATLKTTAFALTFIVIVIIVHIFAGVTNSLIKAVSLGFVNRIAGMIFNCLKTGFILSIILGLLNFFDPGSKLISKKDKADSFLYLPVSAIAPLLFPYLRIDSFNFKLDKPKKPSDTVLKQT